MVIVSFLYPILSKHASMLPIMSRNMCPWPRACLAAPSEAFIDAGYTKRQALEVLIGLAAKIISNFTNALAHTELYDRVKPLAWVHPSER
ncbi:hypothetical protein [Mesorhizobium sp. B3-2-1]|uniref:hypothetical protein n=1 Tax=Mesorhizobium sp. B3-2-1 TaxID=2589891 RepID=UPI001AED9392|nr:hypothetical protein [Mesorhizobium sp. B3-2-1]